MRGAPTLADAPRFRISAGGAGKARPGFYLAHSMARKQEKIKTFAVGVLPHLIVAGAVLGLLLLQPDFGTALILTVVLYLLLFVGGARIPHLLGTGALALPVLAYVMLTAEYRCAA